MTATTPQLSTLLDAWVNNSIGDLGDMEQQGLCALSSIGSENGSPAMMAFSGAKAGAVFLKLQEIMQTLPEYQAFIESLGPVNGTEPAAT